MVFYEWEETREDIYDSLPTQSANKASKEDCVLHGSQMSEKYSEFEQTVKGVMLPWEPDVKKYVSDAACCCTPVKRRKSSSGSNMPQQQHHWALYEFFQNQLNSEDSRIPTAAHNFLREVLTQHVNREQNHIQRFLDLLQRHLKLPYTNSFEIKNVSEGNLETIMGSGDFFLRLQEKKYNCQISRTYDGSILTVDVTAACHNHFKAIKSYIMSKVRDDEWDELFSLFDDKPAEPKPVRPRTNPRKDVEQRLQRHLVAEGATTKVAFSFVRQKHATCRKCPQLCRQHRDVFLKLKKPGKLHPSKHNAAEPLKVRGQGQRKPQLPLPWCVSETELEEFAMLHIMMGDEELPVPENMEKLSAEEQQALMANFSFKGSLQEEDQTQNEQMLTDINDNYIKDTELPENEFSSMSHKHVKAKETIDIQPKSLLMGLLNIKHGYNKFWLTLMVYFMLCGVCLTYCLH